MSVWSDVRAGKRRTRPSRRDLLLAHLRWMLLVLLLAGLAGCAATTSPVVSSRTTSLPSPSATACAPTTCAMGTGLASAQLIVEPDDGASPITGAIASATSSVQMEMYLLTDTRVEQALEEAANRGVNVSVLLELNPVGEDPTGPQKTYNTLAAAGVHMKAADPSYTLTHEKAMIVDGATLYVMTCNLSKSALGGSSAVTNREYAVVDTDVTDVREAQAVFQADWDRTVPMPAQVADPNLLVSPVNARAKLTTLITSATRALLLDQEEMYDPALEDALIAAAKRGVSIEVLLPQPSPGAASPDVTRLAQGGVQVGYTTKLYMHAKMILADGALAYVGSENFSAQSLDSNRELGVLVADSAALARIASTFALDWSTAQAA